MRSTVRTLAVIPARGGSKAIPRKNLALLGGVPLLAYSIAAALAARAIDATVVSTEDDEIARFARGRGADVPFLRPDELATDEAMAFDVVLHALDQVERSNGKAPEFVVLLHPTSPFRTADDIDRCVDLLISTDAPAVVTVSEAIEHPYWMHRMKGDLLVPLFPDEDRIVPRQQLPRVVWENGMVVALRTEAARRTRSSFPPGTLGIVTDASRSIDIDTPHDLARAEALLASGAVPRPAGPART